MRYVNRAAAGITSVRWYWSSSESAFYEEAARGHMFGPGVQQPGLKYNIVAGVRAVRAF